MQSSAIFQKSPNWALYFLALLFVQQFVIKSNFHIVKDSTKYAKKQKEKYSTFPEDWKANLHIHVLVNPNPKLTVKCGGCIVLWEMYDSLIQMGITAGKSPWDHCPTNEDLSESITKNKTIVIVYPEILDHTCYVNGKQVNVRWILAPLHSYENNQGKSKKIASNFRRWGEEDLVFNFASSTAVHPDLLPSSNILQVISNPKDGDRFDLPPAEVFNDRNRTGTAFVVRKGPKWHKKMDRFHTSLPKPHVELTDFHDAFLRNYRFFVSYDPYTFYSYTAAMLGAISIVHPVDNTTKKEWAEGTYVGEFLKAKRLDNVPGIAYGPTKEEIEYAKRTMPELRGFLMEVRKWGKTVSVERFARDCYRYGKGKKSESGIFVRDAYTKWYGANNKRISLVKSSMTY